VQPLRFFSFSFRYLARIQPGREIERIPRLILLTADERPQHPFAAATVTIVKRVSAAGGTIAIPTGGFVRILIVLLLGLVLAAYSPESVNRVHTLQAADSGCGPAGRAYVRTSLYFGLSRPAGTVDDTEWQAFLREEVTPRFPDGLTVWEADGQWRRADASIARERAKVLLLVHDGQAKAHRALTEVVMRYKQHFQQESVLWESARVCATF